MADANSTTSTTRARKGTTTAPQIDPPGDRTAVAQDEALERAEHVGLHPQLSQLANDLNDDAALLGGVTSIARSLVNECDFDIGNAIFLIGVVCDQINERISAIADQISRISRGTLPAIEGDAA